MADLVPPQSVFNPAAGELQTPSSDTTQDPSTSSVVGGTRKKLDPAALAAQQAVEQANLDVNAAAAPALGNQTVQDFNAGIVSQQAAMHPEDEALQATSKQAVGALPDPFQPGAAPAAEDPQQKLITQQQAQDRVAQFKADEEERQAQASQEEQARIEAERQKRVDAAMQRLNQTATEYEQKSKLTSYKEDRGVLHNILGAIAAGLGAYGAIRGHSQNFALDIINKEMDQDMERKKMAMEAAFNKYRQAGMAPEQIAAWAKTQHENLLAKQQAQLATVEKLGAKMLAPFPVEQQKFLQGTAAKAQEQAKDTRDFLEKSTGITSEARTTTEGQKHTTVRSTKSEEGKSAGQAVVAKSALDAAKENQKYLNGLDEEEYGQVTQAYKRGQAAAEHNDEGFKGSSLHRAGAAISEGAYEATNGLVGTPASGFQAARLAGGEPAESFISRDEKVTGAVVGMTNPRAAANPEALAKLAEKRGSAVEGISLEEARRRNAEHIKVLEAETDRQAKPLAKIEATAARRTGTAPPAPLAPAAPKSKAEQQKALIALPTADRAKAAEAMAMKKSHPEYAKAQAWLAKRGLK